MAQTLPQVLPDMVFQVASGFMAAKHLFVANEIGLFAALADGPRTLDELATGTGVPRRTLRITTDAMVALGFLERVGADYANGPVADTYLAGRTPADLRPFLRFWNAISYRTWMNLDAAVRSGSAQEVRLDAEQQRIFSEGVEAVTAGAAQALAGAYDFRAHRRLLDVGGGTGSFLVALLRAYPELRATLFELPAVTALVAGRAASAGFDVVTGDFLRDPIPGGFDAILVANVAHLFGPDKNLSLLRGIRAAAGTGARLLLVDFWTNDAHTDPVFAALMAGEFLTLTGEGDVYGEGEVREWLGRSGWRYLERRPLAGPASLIIAEAH